MSELNVTDFFENEEGEKWYLKRILEAVENDNLEGVLSTLQHAWSSGYDITETPVSVLEPTDVQDESGYVDSLENILEDYFEDKISSGLMDVEDRIKIYKQILPFDVDLAYSLIKRVKEDGEYSVGFSNVLNPEELDETQISHYEYIIDNDLGHYQLYEVLRNDGHFNGEASYGLNKAMKDKILKYAKDYIEQNSKNQKNINFMKAKELRDFFTERENF